MTDDRRFVYGGNSITLKQVEKVRKLREQGMSLVEIAKKLNMLTRHVAAACEGDYWRFVP